MPSLEPAIGQSAGPSLPVRSFQAVSGPPPDEWWGGYFRYFGAVGQPDAFDSRRRARILVIACHGAMALMTVSAALRVATGRTPPASYWIAMLLTWAAMATGPFVLKLTLSVGKAAILPIVATATSLPITSVGAGGLDAPVLAILPSVPLVAAFFIGARGAKALTFVLMVELGALAIAFQTGVLSAKLAPAPVVKATLYASFLVVTTFIAMAYDHERRAVEHRLRTMAQQLYESSIRDPLTNVNNRRYFAERLEREMAFSARHRTPIAVLILDADHFKAVNDTRGHSAGDTVLIGLAATLVAHLRTEDLVARYGGEEFVVLLRDTSCEGARVVGERLRRAVAAMKFEHGGSLFSVTVSVGCASTCRARSGEDLLIAADQCLYEAKRLGRNRVIACDDVALPEKRSA
ncbi:MAG: diguanylate cyclase [Polyangiaceae bacterium]|nr:diguanylate cyclase [Polyangiaceae bacterium]